MPKRNRLNKTVMGGPQGDDAKLVVTMLTVGEQREFLLTGRDLEPGSDAQNRAVGERLATLVHAWNWVDDDDTPLPQPAGNPDVFTQLTGEELAWISQALFGTTPDAQKKLTSSVRS